MITYRPSLSTSSNVRVKRAGAPRCATVAPSPSYVTGSTVPLSLATTVGGSWPSAGSRLTRTRSTRWCGTTIAPSGRAVDLPPQRREPRAVGAGGRTLAVAAAQRLRLVLEIGDGVLRDPLGRSLVDRRDPLRRLDRDVDELARRRAGSTCASALERAGFPATTSRPTKTTAPASAAAPTARLAPRTAKRPSQPRLRAASASRTSSGRAAQTIASEERTATFEPNSVVCGASSSAASRPIETA